MWWVGLGVSLLGLVSLPGLSGGEQWRLGQWVGIQQLGGIPPVQTRIDVYPDCPFLDCAAYWQYEILFTTGEVFGVQAGKLPPIRGTSSTAFRSTSRRRSSRIVAPVAAGSIPACGS